ncbi:MAG: hypothetical protein AAGD14_19280, partial [Planctomycetota bacterium]
RFQFDFIRYLSTENPGLPVRVPLFLRRIGREHGKEFVETGRLEPPDSPKIRKAFYRSDLAP